MEHADWDRRTNAWSACYPLVTDTSASWISRFLHNSCTADGGVAVGRYFHYPLCCHCRAVFSRARQHPDALHMAHAAARRKKHHLTYLHS
jgi:hypothetical protein